MTFKLSFVLFFGLQGAKKKRIVPSNEVLDKSRGAASLGGVRLSELLTSYAVKTQNEAALKVGIVGNHTFCFLYNDVTCLGMVVVSNLIISDK